MSKKARRAAAIKKAKRMKTLKVALIVAAAVVVVAIASFFIYLQNIERVFTDGSQTVILYNDKTFSAKLAHESKKGNYTEQRDGARTVVTFAADGESADGYIEGNNLTLPAEWIDEHGHGSVLKKR